MSEAKFKKGDTVYWIEAEEEALIPYDGYDDPADWIVKGKVVSTYRGIEGEGIEPYPMYIVCTESPIDAQAADYVIGENELFADVSSIYDSIIKNVTDEVLRKELEYIKERKKHTTSSYSKE